MDGSVTLALISAILIVLANQST